jgi:hypothetical protein
MVDRFGLGSGLSMLGMLMFILFIPVRVLDNDPE